MTSNPKQPAWTSPPMTVVSGAGSPVVVVHGGPGMDSSYLRALDDLLAGSTELVYYEQLPRLGEVDAGPANADLQVDELRQVVSNVSKRAGCPICLLAHSWGSYLALQALADSETRSQTRALVLMNPLPLTWERFGEAGNRLIARVRPEDLDEVTRLEELATEESGRELMRLVDYAYLAPVNRDRVDITFARYSPIVNAAVLSSVDGYDQRGSAEALSDLPLLLVYGDADHFEPADSQELHEHGRVRVLEDCGHFPCHEAPGPLTAELHTFLETVQRL